jgi:hypothetical protein
MRRMVMGQRKREAVSAIRLRSFATMDDAAAVERAFNFASAYLTALAGNLNQWRLTPCFL